jgi:diguanylate cyclase (GGDEF)-like protein
VEVAERLRRRIEATEVRVEGRGAPGLQRVHMTASVGIAASRVATDLDSLLRAADGALYAAKHEGRNTVRVAPAAVLAA